MGLNRVTEHAKLLVHLFMSISSLQICEHVNPGSHIHPCIAKVNIDSLKLVYFARFHTVVKYAKIFWCNQHNVNKVFILPKRILRIKLGWGYRSSSRAWFKQLEI
jgi:hypothetical protein